MGGFLFGYDSSVINGAVEAIRERYSIGSGTLAQLYAHVRPRQWAAYGGRSPALLLTAWC